MIVKGIVETIVFQNVENGYTVADIDNNGELVTIVGKMPALREGQIVSATGKFVSSKKWGEQFAVEQFEISEPTSVEGIKRYLSSGLIKGVGPVTASAIVDTFGEKTLEIIELNPLKLAEIKGISLSKAAEIGKTLFELRKMQDVVLFLQQHDISMNLSVRIYETYQNKTKDVLEQNPYKLVEDVSGVGFRTADKIAQKMGVAKDSNFRVRAGILHVLNESSDHDGNTYLPKDEVFSAVEKLLEITFPDHTQLNLILNQMSIDGIIKELELDGVLSIMLNKFYIVEKKLAQKLLLLKMQAPTLHLDVDAEIAEFERVNKVELHKDQKNAIEVAINTGVCVITGGPGTGKTTIIKVILNCLKKAGKKVALLAPTGRAAKRLSESCNEEAKTIHRALIVDHTRNFGNDQSQLFVYNENNRFPFDAVIVDEVSMVDVNLAYNLIRSLKSGCKLLLVGDKNQLPSVGAGNVLSDIIGSEIIPYCNLTQIYRQEEASLITTNAHLINSGEMPKFDNHSKDFFFETKKEPEEILRTVVNLQCHRIPKFLNIEPTKIQVLSAMKSGICGVDNLNNRIQDILNPASINAPEIVVGQTTFRLNDKVMQTTNNYNLEWKRASGKMWELGEGVFNGDIGFITGVNLTQQSIEVTFEDGRICEYPRNEIGQLTLSYAITIHKSQGSEFEVVIIPLVGGAPSILTRNLLYTGITRARQMVVLVGQKFHMQAMIRNNYTAKRYSALKIFLQEQVAVLRDLTSQNSGDNL